MSTMLLLIGRRPGNTQKLHALHCCMGKFPAVNDGLRVKSPKREETRVAAYTSGRGHATCVSGYPQH